MSITIDSDLITLMNKLRISQTKMQEMYANKTVKEIVEAEAESGNQAAVKYAEELFRSPDMLVRIFKLADTNNKLELLGEMSSDELQALLPFLEEEDLNQGLYFFDMNMLLRMLEEIPPEQLVDTVFEMFSEEQIVQYLPEEELDKFLESTDLNKNQIMKHLSEIPREYLAQMYEAISGEDSDKSTTQEILKNVSAFSPMQFNDALNALQPVAKQRLTLGIASEHKELYQNFSAHAYTNMMQTYKFQPEVAQAMQVIEPEEKIKMLENLPDDLLSLVLTQLDPQVFAEQLIKQNPELIADIILK